MCKPHDATVLLIKSDSRKGSMALLSFLLSETHGASSQLPIAPGCRNWVTLCYDNERSLPPRVPRRFSLAWSKVGHRRRKRGRSHFYFPAPASRNFWISLA